MSHVQVKCSLQGPVGELQGTSVYAVFCPGLCPSRYLQLYWIPLNSSQIIGREQLPMRHKGVGPHPHPPPHSAGPRSSPPAPIRATVGGSICTVVKAGSGFLFHLCHLLVGADHLAYLSSVFPSVKWAY